jgi:hypothetical protein
MTRPTTIKIALAVTDLGDQAVCGSWDDKDPEVPDGLSGTRICDCTLTVGVPAALAGLTEPRPTEGSREDGSPDDLWFALFLGEHGRWCAAYDPDNLGDWVRAKIGDCTEAGWVQVFVPYAAKVLGEPGSVISGTMRFQDLIPAFNAELERLTGRDDDCTPIPRGAAEDENDPWWDSEEAGLDLEHLFEQLNEHSPPGHFFGAHPGDGADYGYGWWSEDDDHSDPCYEAYLKGGAPAVEAWMAENHPDAPSMYCQPCEETYPMLNGVCAVCGTPPEDGGVSVHGLNISVYRSLIDGYVVVDISGSPPGDDSCERVRVLMNEGVAVDWVPAADDRAKLAYGPGKEG